MFICATGSVHCVNEKGKTRQVLSTDSLVRKLLLLEERDVLLVITENLQLSLHAVSPEGEAEELMKVRIMLQDKLATFILYKFFVVFGLSLLCFQMNQLL